MLGISIAEIPDRKAVNMLKDYLMPNGHTYQFEEGKQPEMAVLVEKEKKVANKAKKPANKAKKAAKK